jgi:hypothetical protein
MLEASNNYITSPYGIKLTILLRPFEILVVSKAKNSTKTRGVTKMDTKKREVKTTGRKIFIKVGIWLFLHM